MHRIISKLERKVGPVWAYLLLFLITWMLVTVICAFLEVNTIVKQYRQQAATWSSHWLEPVIDELKEYESSPFFPQNMAEWFDQQKSPLLKGVALVGASENPLLSVTAHPRYPNLNLFTSSHDRVNETVTAVYPLSGVSALFFGVDLTGLKTLPLFTGENEAEPYSYSFLYSENRYFMFVRPPKASLDNRLFVYDLDSVFKHFLQEVFSSRTQYIERESLFGEEVLKDRMTHNLALTSHTFDLTKMSVPVRYQIQVPVLIEHLDWIKVLYRGTLASIVLYLILFFYDRFEKRALRRS